MSYHNSSPSHDFGFNPGTTPTPKLRIVLIDNYDSFVYNLVEEIRCLGYDLVVYRNSVPVSKVLDELNNSEYTPLLMISPGPGDPSQAGNVLSLIKKVRGIVPVLGVCLGHQAIIEAYGGEICHASETVHGKSSPMDHEYGGPFYDLPQPMHVARYHSLAGHHIPESLDVIGRYKDIPMAVYSARNKVLGFQFHPESILTPQGSQLLDQSFRLLSAAA